MASVAAPGRAGSARTSSREGESMVMTVSKIEIRAATSLGGSTAGRPPRTGSAKRIGAPPKPVVSAGGRQRPSTAPKKVPAQQGGGKAAPSGGMMLWHGAKVANLQLDVPHSGAGKHMHGSALVRPSSAVYGRPDSANTRPGTGKKPPTAMSAATTHKDGSRAGTADGGSSRPDTAWTNEGTVDANVRELSAIDSEDSLEHAPLAGAGLPPKHPGQVGGYEIGKVGGNFDFTTMEDLGAGGEPQHRQTVHSRILLSKNSGKALKHTGIPPDTHKSMTLFTGEPFDMSKLSSGREAHVAKQKYGFRSGALHLQVSLSEKLRIATDSDAQFLVFQEAFEEVIRVDASYSEILQAIKNAYDDRLRLVPASGGDAVAMSEYLAAVQREERAAAEIATLEEENERLKGLAAEASAARVLLASREGGDDGGEAEADRELRSGEPSPRARHEAAMEQTIRELKERAAALEVQLEAEADERVRVEALLETLSAKQDVQLNLKGIDHGHAGPASQRDTARSAASGYDDHPTHRTLGRTLERPSAVPQLTEEAWAHVHQKRAEEAEEEEAWAAQDAAAEGQGPGDEGYDYGDDGGQYDDEGGEYDDEYDEEDEELMREHYMRQIRAVQDEQGVDEDEAIEILMREQEREQEIPPRPHSKMLEGRGDEGGEDYDDDDYGDERDSRGDVDDDHDDGENESGKGGEGGEDSSADTYSQSDRSLGESGSQASSFLSSREGGDTDRGGGGDGGNSARMDVVAEEAEVSAEASGEALAQQRAPSTGSKGEPRVFCG